MMAVARNIGDANSSFKDGKWERSRLTGIEAKGKTLAIVGLGKGIYRSPSLYVLCSVNKI
jgi:D-3-phosphoglycerate dehydrogenase